VEGLSLAPDADPIEKIRQLEDEVCEWFPTCFLSTYLGSAARLKNQLFEKEQALSRSITPNQHQSNLPSTSPISQNSSLTRPTSSTSGVCLPQASITMMNLIEPDSPQQAGRNDSGSPELTTAAKSTSDPFMDLLFSGWNPDLPDPNTLNH
jgi:hypothetical protein